MTIEASKQPLPYSTPDEAVDYFRERASETMSAAGEHFGLAANLPKARRKLRENGCEDVTDAMLQMHHIRTGNLLVEGYFHFIQVAEAFRNGERRVSH